jgi:hypothetical protein
MNTSIASIHEYKDRFEIANPFEAVLNTVYRNDMTLAQARMMERLIDRFCGACFEIERWVNFGSSGYHEDCTLHILSERRREFCRRGKETVRGV